MRSFLRLRTAFPSLWAHFSRSAAISRHALATITLVHPQHGACNRIALWVRLQPQGALIHKAAGVRTERNRGQTFPSTDSGCRLPILKGRLLVPRTTGVAVPR